MTKSPEEVRETFQHFDQDKSGSIEVGEFVRLLRALGAAGEPEEVAAGLEALDANGNGRIDFDEFAAWWSGR